MRTIIAALTLVGGGCNALVSFDQPAERGAQCNDGVDNDGNGAQDCGEASCADVCFPCGNGRPDPGELCDDGNLDNSDACLATCVPAGCGDGFVRIGVEDCDDGNGEPGDGCEPGTCAYTCAAGVAADSRGFDPATGHCYLGFTAALDVQAAELACEGLRGYLAVPDDPIEDGLVRAAAPDSASLGLADTQLDSFYGFRMVTGDIGTEYLNFSVGQPDAPLDQVICVSYDGAAPTWQDNDCTTPRPYVCELHPQACGDAVRQPGEECDDGNSVADDGCDASCLDVDECALGVDNCSPDADCINQPWQPFSPGFACMCRNGFVGDGVSCTPVPPAPVFELRGPAPISGPLLNCTTATSHDGRKVALDGFGGLYAVMLCAGDAYAMVSVDAGATWTSPVQLGTGIQEAAVVGMAPGRAAVAMQLTSGDILVRQTLDFGASWGPPGVVSAITGSQPGVSLATDGFDVLVGFVTGTDLLRVARSQDPGLTSFTAAYPLTVAHGDILVDPQNPTQVWAVGDTPDLHVIASGDGGLSFPGAESMPPGAQALSDWAIGGGRIFATGDADGVVVIPVSAPGTSTVVTGLAAAAPGERAIAADPAGTVVVAQAGVTSGVEVVRLASGASVFDQPRGVDALGTSPSIAVVPSGLVVVVYRAGEQIRFAVVAP